MEKSLNILFVCEVPIKPHKGGAERVTSLLAGKFIENGHNVSYLSTQGFIDDEPKKEGKIPQYFINDKDVSFIEDFKKIIKREKIEIIINQSIVPSTRLLLKNINDLNVKVLSVLHMQPFAVLGKEYKYKKNTHPETFKGQILKYIGMMFPFIYRKERLKYDRSVLIDFIEYSDYLILLSERFKERLYSNLPNIKKEKIKAINNPNTFKEEPSGEKENMILYVGRMVDPQKNLKDFIDLWLIFSRNHPDWKCVVIGDGPHKQYFENYACKEVAKRLTFVGNQEDVASFYKRAKIFLMTSLYEGWPMVLAEAMAYGCVPVAYDTFEALHDIINNGETGFIVPAFDKKEMVNKLSEIADNEVLRKQLMYNAEKHIKAFDIEIIGQQWQKLFEEILAK